MSYLTLEEVFVRFLSRMGISAEKTTTTKKGYLVKRGEHTFELLKSSKTIVHHFTNIVMEDGFYRKEKDCEVFSIKQSLGDIVVQNMKNVELLHLTSQHDVLAIAS